MHSVCMAVVYEKWAWHVNYTELMPKIQKLKDYYLECYNYGMEALKLYFLKKILAHVADFFHLQQ